MLAAHNILKPSDGKPVISPSQDMVLGVYCLTMIRPGAKGEGMIFTDINEAKMANACGELSLQAKVKIRMSKVINGVEYQRLVETSLGRVIFNEPIPQDMGVQKRDPNDIDSMFRLEIDRLVGKKDLSKIVDRCYRTHGVTTTSEMLDAIKSMGYYYSTRFAVTKSVADIQVPSDKPAILAKAQDEVHKVERQFGAAAVRERALSVGHTHLGGRHQQDHRARGRSAG